MIETHAEGIKRVRELKSKEYAFTTDAENDEKAKSAATVQYYKDANSNYVMTKSEIVTNLLSKNNLPTDSEKSDDVSDEECEFFHCDSINSATASAFIQSNHMYIINICLACWFHINRLNSIFSLF